MDERKEIGLNEQTAEKDPFKQFEVWYNEIQKSGTAEPTAMIIATANKKGIPTVRTVLLKSYDKQGFVFFTNYESRKGHDLAENHSAAILFLWKEEKRQVRISGSIVKTSKEESEKYFRSRPIESQLGAWASKQSSVIPNREHLIQNYEKYKRQFEGKEIPLPPNWGGYRVIPEEFEFWQGRENRLHDRICYIIKGKEWHISRLSP